MTLASRLDIPESKREAAIVLLQARLVDAIDLKAQMKQAHWNVKGRDFFQLHQLFDQINGVVEEFVDTLAERIVALGGTADGRIATVAQTSKLPQFPLQAASQEDHLQAVADALATFGTAVRNDIDHASQIGDQGTADVFTGLSRESDKQLWFVEAHLA